MSRPITDLEVFRSVSISDVLRDAGIEPPLQRRRMRCPIHNGDNTTAFSFNERRYCCFACGSRGDVFELARALHGLTFRDAISHIARLAGADARAPHPTSREIQRQGIVARRRIILQTWREDRLTALVDELRNLDRRVEIAGLSLTSRSNGSAAAWETLAEAHSLRDAREYELSLLQSAEEREWLNVLAQRPREAACVK
ncbi:MAG: hypothetical protein HY270_01685 [Deltaproteobacteria bacterium]|nr:hypothetical protein [Deltaproteobacteria bacterium]